MATHERVELPADGLRLVGHLHRPERSLGLAPAIVIASPTPSVKEQVGDRYGRLLAGRGFACLTFDSRNFGESGGKPRQREETSTKVVDVRGAVTFLRGLEGVDPERIAALGISIGAGYALKAAAFDPRIKAFVGIAGYYPSPYLTRETMGADAYRAALADALEPLEERDRSGRVAYLPLVDQEGGEQLAPPGRLTEEVTTFYLSERGSHPRFQNRVTRDTSYMSLVADLAIGADFLSPTPALVIHGENDFPPSDADSARAVYERLGDPKRLLMLETQGHIDLYDVDAFVTPAADAAAAFLTDYL